MPAWLAWLVLAVLDALIILGCIAFPPECVKQRKRSGFVLNHRIRKSLTRRG